MIRFLKALLIIIATIMLFVMLVEVITTQKFVFTLIESTLISTVYTLFFVKMLKES